MGLQIISTNLGTWKYVPGLYKIIAMRGKSKTNSKLVTSGEFLKIGRGHYAIPDPRLSEQQILLETVKPFPDGVVCLLSALRFHGLIAQSPFEVWLAIESKALIPKIMTLPLRIMLFTGKAFSESIEMHEIEGVSFRVYNPAKTVADCFKYRSKIGLDVALEALRNVWRQRKATMDELWYYAKICRMTNVMRPYLESLVCLK